MFYKVAIPKNLFDWQHGISCLVTLKVREIFISSTVNATCELSESYCITTGY